MPFRCTIILEVREHTAGACLASVCDLWSELRCVRSAFPGIAYDLHLAHLPPVPDPATIPNAPPPEATAPRPRRKAAPVAQPPAAVKPRRKPGPKPRKHSGAGVPPATAQPPRLCEHCGAPLHPKAPKKSRVCSKPECKKATRRVAWKALPRERRIEIIRGRHARILAKKEAAAPPEPPDDDGESARDLAELDRLANLAKE